MGLSQPPATQVPGSIDGSSSAFPFDVRTSPVVAIQITGTWVGTIVFESSVDGINYIGVSAVKMSTGAPVSNTTANDIFAIANPGHAFIRARLSAYTSGRATLTCGTGFFLPPSSSGASVGTVDQGAAGASPWPVSIAGIALPAGASTEAKQDSEITQATATNTVLGATTDAKVTGDNNGTIAAKLRGVGTILADVWDSVNHRLKVDGSGVTQPVSAAALPLPTGAATEATLAAVLTIADFDTKIGSLTEAAPASDTASSGLNGRLQRIAQRLTTLLAVFPATIDTNSGNKSASTLRVVLATDQPALTNKLLVTPDSVALPANQSVNVSQINGATPLMGAGNTGTGSHRTTIATDQVALPTHGHGATGASVPAGATQVGALAHTALPTAVTAGQLVAILADVFGRPSVNLGTIRGLRGTQATTITNTTETTVVTAGGAGVFNDLALLVISNISAVATYVDIRDDTAGTIIVPKFMVPAGQVVGFGIPGSPVPQTAANKNWTVQAHDAVTSLNIFAMFDKNK